MDDLSDFCCPYCGEPVDWLGLDLAHLDDGVLAVDWTPCCQELREAVEAEGWQAVHGLPLEDCLDQLFGVRPREVTDQGVIFVAAQRFCQFTLLVRADFGYERTAYNLVEVDLEQCVGREPMCAAAVMIAIDRQYPLLVGPQDGRLLLSPPN